jgi:NAD-dependent deacetylase
MVDITAARQIVAGASRVGVLSGAGLSTDSGIPDFRGPNGLWTKQPGAQRLFDINAYLADRALRVQAWRNRREHTAWDALPNAGHRALADLESQGRLTAIATQNIDGLHQAAGSTQVLELHGTIWAVVCMQCGDRTPMRDTFDRLDAGEQDPPCVICGGILKSATVSFGQALDPDVLQAAAQAAGASDVYLVTGSSLQVQPAASLCELAVEHGAVLLVLNAQPTPYDELASRSGGGVVRDSLSDVLPQLVDA